MDEKRTVLNVKHDNTLFRIKIRYREILLRGRISSFQIRLQRLEAFRIHILKGGFYE